MNELRHPASGPASGSAFGPTTGRWPALALATAVSAVLAGCGGSSGDEELFDIDDVNADGVIDTPIGEPDANGVQAYDIDGNGVADELLLDGGYDVNGDGFEDFDVDRDGNVDRSVVNANGLVGYDLFDSDTDATTPFDGIAVVDEDNEPLGDGFVEPTASEPCGSEPGDDPDSSNNDWSDNCEVSRFGQWADSLYSAGVQRILWCSGFGNASSVDAFTDGEFGPGTESALEAFQSANGLTADGIVGPQTWQALRERLTEFPLEFAQGGGTEAYGVQGDRCEDIALFLNEVTLSNDGALMGGWQLTEGASNDSAVPFSIAEPFGRID